VAQGRKERGEVGGGEGSWRRAEGGAVGSLLRNHGRSNFLG